MKNIITIIFSLILLSSISLAQQINIHTSGGTDTYNLAEIDSITFTVSDDTSTTGIVTDIDGNTYKTIKIGNQWWMAENLKVAHYRNGDPIPNVTSDSEWNNLSTGAYCNYGNSANNATTYGRLYNWYAVKDNRNIAPSGWHVPTDEEWETFVNYLGGSGVAGGKMKEAGTAHWDRPNNGATNESGLSALPGGYRYYRHGSYHSMGSYAFFWSSSESPSSYAWSRRLYYSASGVYRSSSSKRYGFSVRCVRD